jgi:uncharacterized protein YndB with AHSA1/START domain
MTAQATDTSVQVQIVVDASIEDAFRVCTEDIASWWPSGHHLLEGEDVDLVFEAREGGHIYDRGADGSQCRWARVLVCEPPNRLVFSWEINPQWKLETDLRRASEVEVRFHAEGANRTRVELEHRNLDRHGEGWEQKRDAVGSPEGWPEILQAFVERVSP